MENFDRNNSDNKIEELDLRDLSNLILRNKKIIIPITIISFFVSCLIGITRKKVWQGQFEIVLSKSKDDKGSSILGALEDFNLGDLSNKDETLNTEVGILESPLVLMPVFEYVKEKKSNKNLIFSDWKQNNLETQLRKKTSILNISYNDENKELIIPVLKKISSAYQEYSGKKSKRSNQLAKNYLEDQIKIFKVKSKETRKEAITYAIENDLTFSDMEGATIYDDTAINKLLPGIKTINPNQLDTYLNSFQLPRRNVTSNIRDNSIESIRVSAVNEIKNIDSQIEKIEKLNKVEDLQYLGSTIPSLLNLGLPQILEDIETDLVELKSKYTSNDVSIKRLMDKRELYAKLLKERSLGYLKARKLASQALLESVKRPKGTTIKGKELMREANRDEETLVQLENKFRQVQLMAAKSEDPWELITTPTLQSFPIKPNKRRIALIGTFIGFGFGTAISMIKEKRSQLVFEEEELESLFNLPILKRLKYEDGQIQESTNELKFNEIKKVSKDKLTIFLTSGLASNYLKDLENYFSQSSLLDKNIQLITEDLPKTISKDSFFLLTSLEKIDYPEIKNIKKRFEYNKINLSGIILLTNT